MHRISPTLTIYLARQFGMAFAMVLVIIVGLNLLFDVIELLRRAVTIEDAKFPAIAAMALLKLPHTAEDTLPFVVMISVMFAIFRLARSHQLVVMRSAGVSAWQLLMSPLGLMAAIGLLNLAVINPFAAQLYDEYQREEDALFHHNAPALNLSESGLWLREAQGNTASILHAASFHQDGLTLHLSGVSIFEIDNHQRLIRRYEADQGELTSGRITLRNAWEMEPNKAAAFRHEVAKSTAITPETVQNSFTSPESMSVWELPKFIRFSEESGFSVMRPRLYWQSLLATPILLLAMVLVAACFFLSAGTRGVAWTWRGIAGLGTGFSVYFFSRFTYTLGLSSNLPLVLAAWAPATVTLLLGLGYLFHREDG